MIFPLKFRSNTVVDLESLNAPSNFNYFSPHAIKALHDERQSIGKVKFSKYFRMLKLCAPCINKFN